MKILYELDCIDQDDGVDVVENDVIDGNGEKQTALISEKLRANKPGKYFFISKNDICYNYCPRGNRILTSSFTSVCEQCVITKYLIYKRKQDKEYESTNS